MTKEPCRSAEELPFFDPKPSSAVGVRVLRAAGVPFALAGRVAVWTYVPPSGQMFTKDVDFAVPYGYGDAIKKAAEEAGLRVTELGIGGVGMHAPGVVVDAIDRHPHAAELFADAVKAAQEGDKWAKGEGEPVPVVPKMHLIAMKLIPHADKDDRDVEELLKTLTAEEYREARRLVEKYLGPLDAEHLDALAMRIGHAGVEPRYGL